MFWNIKDFEGMFTCKKCSSTRMEKVGVSPFCEDCGTDCTPTAGNVPEGYCGPVIIKTYPKGTILPPSDGMTRRYIDNEIDKLRKEIKGEINE